MVLLCMRAQIKHRIRFPLRDASLFCAAIRWLNLRKMALLFYLKDLRMALYSDQPKSVIVTYIYQTQTDWPSTFNAAND